MSENTPLNEKIKTERLVGLLMAFSPKNKGIGFSKTFSQQSGVGGSELVPSFNLNIPLPDRETAVLVQQIFKMSQSSFPYPVKLKIGQSSSGFLLSITSVDDVYQSVMKFPRYSPAINLELFAKYTAFRALCSQLSKWKVYNIAPGDRPAKNQYAVTSTPEIDKIVSESITERDIRLISEQIVAPGIRQGGRPHVSAVVHEKRATPSYRPSR